MSPSLEAVRVLDCSTGLAGRFATMQLADLGADVTSVEWISQDSQGSTTIPESCVDASLALSLVLNRNKRVIEVDVDDRQAIASLQSAAITVDVLVEDAGSELMRTRGLGHGDLEGQNEGLIYCSLSAAGGTVPPAAPGHDLLMQAMGGLMSITGSPATGPQRAGAPLVDSMAGLFTAVGILVALRSKRRDGKGQKLDVDLLAASLAGLVNQGSGYTIAGFVPTTMGNDHPSVAPYGPHESGEGELIVAVGNDRQFQLLCDVLGVPEMGTDPRFATNAARNENREALRASLEDRLKEKSAPEWVQALLERRVPAGVVNNVAQAYEYANELGLDPLVQVAQLDGPAVQMTRNPIRLSASPPVYRFTSSGRGGFDRDRG